MHYLDSLSFFALAKERALLQPRAFVLMVTAPTLCLFVLTFKLGPKANPVTRVHEASAVQLISPGRPVNFRLFSFLE